MVIYQECLGNGKVFPEVSNSWFRPGDVGECLWAKGSKGARPSEVRPPNWIFQRIRR
jgi:hypothetical protein